MRAAVVAGSAAALLALLVAGAGGAGTRPATLVGPIRPSQQTLLPFGERSHWLQPWRGYLETVPARRLVDGLGMVFNPEPGEADLVARELAAAGFHRARLEISWCRVSDTPHEHLTGLASIDGTLRLLQRNHLRPLILLNGNEGCPGPLRRLRVHVAQAAPAGARQLTLDGASAARVVPGRTGLDSTTGYKAAAYLFTGVSGDTVTLSRPLDHPLAAGDYDASTLRYLPFSRPGDASFEETMQGWLRYVGLVTHAAAAVLGPRGFDVEVWNEINFASDFLDLDTYYDPAPAPDASVATERAILDRTVRFIRDPRNGVPHIGIGNGFANTRPWDAGSTSPRGLTAIDKHPYPPRRVFPRDAVFNGVRPVDALGRPDGTRDADGRWHDAFVPRYTAFFPEYFLTGIQTETAIRDLSPITSSVYGTPHGRRTHPPGAAPPTVWVTEAGMDPAGIPNALLPRLHAKAALRFATAWIGKGASSVFLYAVASPGWGVVAPDAPGGGLTLRAVGRLTRTLQDGAAPIRRHRSLSLLAVGARDDREQFAGDGTAAHPPLHNRDVVAFFPFQVSDGRVVVSTYVMTRDLMHSYHPKLSASDPRRYDMPPERFRLRIGGARGLRHVSLSDPLSGRSVPVHVLARRGGSLEVAVPLTDSPRLLVLSTGGGR
jgi:hypothetical protein